MNVVSGGARRDDLVKTLVPESWSVWSVDVRPSEDPHHDQNLRAHVGRHAE